MRRPRFWTYKWGSWKDHSEGDWHRISKWIPDTGGDEFGRLTVVVPIPLVAHLVIALWNSCDWKGHDWSIEHPELCERCGITDDLEADFL